MQRASSVIGSTMFLLLAPGTVAGVVPWWIAGWRLAPPMGGMGWLRWFGVGLIALGVPLLIDSFARFALQGRGTPAPVLPTEHLVVSGLYRYVRNPMYVGVMTVVLGQGLVLGSALVFGYAALLGLTFHVFIVAYEEPKLRRSFAAEYDRYCRNVSRWIPRLRPW
jgi:protein-S-isoprenylcysteine O-methyltransferase Ste14